jgi:hypothetical protein
MSTMAKRPSVRARFCFLGLLEGTCLKGERPRRMGEVGGLSFSRRDEDEIAIVSLLSGREVREVVVVMVIMMMKG